MTTTNEVRQALRAVANRVEERFQADRRQIERLKQEIRDLKKELAEAKRELKTVSPHASRFLQERRTKRKQYVRDYPELDLQPVRTNAKGLLTSEGE